VYIEIYIHRCIYAPIDALHMHTPLRTYIKKKKKKKILIMIIIVIKCGLWLWDHLYYKIGSKEYVNLIIIIIVFGTIGALNC
jgi:hypothetical protein